MNSISLGHRSRASARARLEKRLLEARNNRDKAKQEMKEASRSLQGLVQKQRRCHEERDTLADQLSALKEEVRGIEDRLKTARRQHDRKARRLEKAQQDLAKLKKELADV